MFSVTMTMSFTTAVHPISKSKSSSAGVPATRNRAFSEAYKSIALLIGRIFKADKNSSNCSIRCFSLFCDQVLRHISILLP